MPSAGGSMEDKNSAALLFTRLPAGPTMFSERQDYRSIRRVIYESSVSVAAPCVRREPRSTFFPLRRLR